MMAAYCQSALGWAGAQAEAAGVARRADNFRPQNLSDENCVTCGSNGTGAQPGCIYGPDEISHRVTGKCRGPLTPPRPWAVPQRQAED